MYPTIIDFGPVGIHSYGLMLATAFITAVFVIQSELKRRGFVRELASTIVMAAAIGGIVGAKIYSALLDGQITFQELFSTRRVSLVWRFHRRVSRRYYRGPPLPEPIPTYNRQHRSSRHPRIRHRSNRVLPRWRRRLWTAIRSTVGDGVPEWHCPNRCACPSDPYIRDAPVMRIFRYSLVATP